MGWVRNRTIISYTKKAVRYLIVELDKVMKENPTLSYHDALKKIGTPISWNWSGEATTDLLDRHVEGVEDDEYLFYTVVFLLVRQGLLEELNIIISIGEEPVLLLKTAMNEMIKITGTKRNTYQKIGLLSRFEKFLRDNYPGKSPTIR